MKFIIDYNTGITEEVTGTLEDAKATADEGAAYTQQKIEIMDEDGDTVAVRRWNGVAYDGENEELVEENPICFGDAGYYSDWSEF